MEEEKIIKISFYESIGKEPIVVYFKGEKIEDIKRMIYDEMRRSIHLFDFEHEDNGCTLINLERITKIVISEEEEGK